MGWVFSSVNVGSSDAGGQVLEGAELMLNCAPMLCILFLAAQIQAPPSRKPQEHICMLFLKSKIKSKYATVLEIEALNCGSTASITLFDMLKSYKKRIVI